MGVGRLRKNLKRELDNGEVIINIINDEPIAKVEDVATLKANLKKKTAYITYRDNAGLTPDTWCIAMAISKGRDTAYIKGYEPVPNSILNRAAYVYRRTASHIKRLHERFI